MWTQVVRSAIADPSPTGVLQRVSVTRSPTLKETPEERKDSVLQWREPPTTKMVDSTDPNKIKASAKERVVSTAEAAKLQDQR